jgi:hypothetical protein
VGGAGIATHHRHRPYCTSSTLLHGPTTRHRYGPTHRAIHGTVAHWASLEAPQKRRDAHEQRNHGHDDHSGDSAHRCDSWRGRRRLEDVWLSLTPCSRRCTFCRLSMGAQSAKLLTSCCGSCVPLACAVTADAVLLMWRESLSRLNTQLLCCASLTSSYATLLCPLPSGLTRSATCMQWSVHSFEAVQWWHRTCVWPRSLTRSRVQL